MGEEKRVLLILGLSHTVWRYQKNISEEQMAFISLHFCQVDNKV